jgi:hypothetical protein
MLRGDFRHRSCKKRSVFQSKISWIYLHGIELEKRGTKGDYTKHWLCKLCYNGGTIKIMAASSTCSAQRHLKGDPHSIYALGVIPPTAPKVGMSSLNSYLEAQHPLQAER